MQQMRLADAEAEFAFLRDWGFQRAEGWETDAGSSCDGWRIHYAGMHVNVTIEYLDWQFEVIFERAGIRADHLFLDRELFGHQTGLQGTCFRENYSSVLDGEPSLWERIRRLVQAPREKRRLP
jgi:hypothetical protein